MNMKNNRIVVWYLFANTKGQTEEYYFISEYYLNIVVIRMLLLELLSLLSLVFIIKNEVYYSVQVM